ncbi:hypothetical protein EFP49_05795 [Lactobacillus johnsonii]|uniref:hypothetical protein n=1 Tax=Lactobacillus johnsonii TaxID=33959 RepID=UPI0021A3EC87|nr:hypothetical protein [Lactobacillus johnsonii]MCT3342306.1 hypothetical protein [Lactobacillus johnsonii]
MLDYIKDAWKVSGSLEKKQYFTLPNILWSLFAIFMVFGITQQMLKTPFVSFSYVISQYVETIMTIVLFLAIWYINARFNPFAFKSLRMNFKDAVNGAVKTGKKAYTNTSNEGPLIREERRHPFSNADYVGSVNTRTGKISIEKNKTYKQESNLEYKLRAIGDGLNAGSGQLIINTIFMSVFRLFLWPISFVWALFSMRPYVRAYRNSQI